MSTIDAVAMQRRMDSIRLKQMFGNPLENHELMALQMEQNGFGCACGAVRDGLSDALLSVWQPQK